MIALIYRYHQVEEVKFKNKREYETLLKITVLMTILQLSQVRFKFRPLHYSCPFTKNNDTDDHITVVK